jgi:hypothetical protein
MNDAERADAILVASLLGAAFVGAGLLFDRARRPPADLRQARVGTRHDRVGGDAVRRHLRRDRFGERVHACLGGDVIRLPGAAVDQIVAGEAEAVLNPRTGDDCWPSGYPREVFWPGCSEKAHAPQGGYGRGQ